jgi:hypothetical protein
VQLLYVQGVLDLHCLLALSDPAGAVYLLPGCPGRADVPRAPSSDAQIRDRCLARHPWLAALWRAPMRFFLTGSTLTACLAPRTARVPPGDVDVFVLDVASLDLALQQLCSAAAALGAVVSSHRTSHAKFHVHVGAYDGKQPVRVDLYAHDLTALHNYHMSAARVAFDGSDLFCSPTAVTALATTVSPCFALNWKPERAATIILRKFHSGLNLLVSIRELRSFWNFVRAHEDVFADTLAGFDLPTQRAARELLIRWQQTDPMTSAEYAALLIGRPSFSAVLAPSRVYAAWRPRAT